MGWRCALIAYNHKGDVVALTEGDEELAAYYEYDAWGNTMTEAEKSDVDNPYRYSTKEWDERSGLYYFGVRYYSPEIGRWTQRDPAGTVDGLNLYLYAGNEPVGNIDPWGLQPLMPDPGGPSDYPAKSVLGRIRRYNEYCAKLEREIQNVSQGQRRLKKMYLRWEPGETWSDYGLGEVSNATGGRSEYYWSATSDFRREVDRIEGNAGLTIGNVMQLAIIGTSGYWTPLALFKGQSPREQWMMTRIIIEFSRTYALRSRLEAIYDKKCWLYERCK